MKTVRKAEFVNTSPSPKFKYLKLYKFNNWKSKVLSKTRWFFNYSLEKVRKAFQFVKWKELFSFCLVALVDVVIEGLLANVVTHYLFGVPLSAMTVIAHGVLIRQGISIIQRIKGNGQLPTVSEESRKFTK